MSELPDRRPDLRVSDIDRDRVADVLKDAHGNGRITVDELDERLTSVYAAKTYGDLAPLTSDLPEGQAAGFAYAGAARPSSSRIGGEAKFKFSLALMSGAARAGNWVVPPHYAAVAVMGGIKIDLREASFAQAEVTIQAFALMGGIEILVPEDVAVEISGFGIMGGVDHRADGPGLPGAPKVRINGYAVMGGIGIKRVAASAPAAQLPRSG